MLSREKTARNSCICLEKRREKKTKKTCTAKNEAALLSVWGGLRGARAFLLQWGGGPAFPQQTRGLSLHPLPLPSLQPGGLRQEGRKKYLGETGSVQAESIAEEVAYCVATYGQTARASADPYR